MRRLPTIVLAAAALVGVIAIAGPVAIRLREPDALATLPAGVAGRLVDVGGRHVHVVDAGTGPVVVLVHGFGGSTYDFEEATLAPLARTHRMVALDLFGHGWSERGEDLAYGFALWAEQIAGTLDALGVGRASIVGHSMGGAAAAVFAARHPDRIEKLVLVDAFYPPDPYDVPWPFVLMRTPFVGELTLGLVADASAPGFSAEHHARALPWYRLQGTRAGMLRYVRDPEKLAVLRAAYPAIAAPTLVLHGDADTYVRPSAMRRAAPAIRTATVVTHPGGHFPFRDDPASFTRVVTEFLDAH